MNMIDRSNVAGIRGAAARERCDARLVRRTTQRDLNGRMSGMTVNTTASNKAFIAEMLGQKKRLEDYPERVDPNLVMHEPAHLPFGGTYRGLDDFQRFYPRVRHYYEFSRFELIAVYGDGDTVFATARVPVAGSRSTMFIAKQFTFAGTKLVEVRVHTCDVDPSATPQRRTR